MSIKSGDIIRFYADSPEQRFGKESEIQICAPPQLVGSGGSGEAYEVEVAVRKKEAGRREEAWVGPLLDRFLETFSSLRQEAYIPRSKAVFSPEHRKNLIVVIKSYYRRGPAEHAYAMHQLLKKNGCKVFETMRMSKDRTKLLMTSGNRLVRNEKGEAVGECVVTSVNNENSLVFQELQMNPVKIGNDEFLAFLENLYAHAEKCARAHISVSIDAYFIKVIQRYDSDKIELDFLLGDFDYVGRSEFLDVHWLTRRNLVIGAKCADCVIDKFVSMEYQPVLKQVHDEFRTSRYGMYFS